MKSLKCYSLIVSLSTLIASLTGAGTPSFKADPAAEEILKSEKLSGVEKADKLYGYFGSQAYWPGVLYRLDKIDAEQTRCIALKLFRRPGTSRLLRFQVSRYLLSQADAEFKHEYKEFLIDAIMNGGEEEFCKPREDIHSAVGEYAGIAGGIDRPDGISFGEVKDAKVTPVLIRCLDAPDHVWPENQGGHFRGPPGESSGRNTQRQGLPLALAKLDATTATQKLQEVLFIHPDYYLRYNAAYALAILLPREKSLIIEKLLDKGGDAPLTPSNGNTPLKQLLFPFGKGLIEKGVDEGIRYMSFEYASSINADSLLRTLYVASERMDILKGVKSPKLDGFYKEVFNHPPLYNIFVFDVNSIKYSDLGFNKSTGKTEVQNSPEKGLKMCETRIVKLYETILTELRENRIRSLNDRVSEIADKTTNEEIRRLSREYLQKSDK